MRIDPTTTPAPIATGATGATSPSGASRDQFLRLFVAQLQNQNPLDPQSGADMVAQLAQFSSVEQAVETNKRLADLVNAQDAAGAAGLANLVGREITADASRLTIDGTPPAIELKSSAPITGGEMIIKNEAGTEVRRIVFGAGPSPLAVPWDGRDGNGAQVASGNYTIEVVATGGGATTARPQLRGVVDAVELGSTGSLLRIGNASVMPAAVTLIARTGATL